MLAKLAFLNNLGRGRGAVILGFGIDLVENRRVAQELAREPWRPQDGIFTPEEVRYCGSARKPALCFAACFAAKEATLKALGLPLTDLALFREVELSPAEGRNPQVILHRRLKAQSEQLGVRRIWLAMTHNRRQTGAMVTLVG